MTARLSLISLLCVISVACTTSRYQEIDTSPPELPQQYLYQVEDNELAELSSLLPNADPAFLELKNLAIINSPTLGAALARIETARAIARGSRSNQLPALNGNLNYAETKNNPNQFGQSAPSIFTSDNAGNSYSGNFVATWEIDLFGRLKASENAALARLEAATASAEAVRLVLIAEIAGNIIDWRSLALREAALGRDLEASNRLTQLVQAKEQAGIAPSFDRIRAEAAASQSRSRLTSLDIERAFIIGRLTSLTGISGQSLIRILQSSDPELVLPEAPSSFPSELLQTRPDIRESEAQLRASDADLAAVARSQFPRLNLSATIGFLSFGSLDIFSDDSQVSSMTSSLATSILDFGRLQAEVDLASAKKNLAFANYQQTIFNALGESEEAYAKIAATDKQAEAIKHEYDELERAAFLAEARYNAGLSDFLTVIEARRAADTSGDRFAVSLGETRRARVALWQALGGDYYTITRSINQ